MKKNRNNPKAVDMEKGKFHSTPAQEWAVIVGLIDKKLLDEAFSKLVTLAKSGDAEALFFAHAIQLAEPDFARSPSGLALTQFEVIESPFKHMTKKSPAYKIFAPMSLGVAKKAKKKKDGQAALVMALFKTHSDEATDHKHHNSAKALAYFDIALSDKKFRLAPYHQSLITRNVNGIVESADIQLTKKDPEHIRFPDGSKVSVDLLYAVVRKMNRRCVL